jgi:hypothetical protein
MVLFPSFSRLLKNVHLSATGGSIFDQPYKSGFFSTLLDIKIKRLFHRAANIIIPSPKNLLIY